MFTVTELHQLNVAQFAEKLQRADHRFHRFSDPGRWFGSGIDRLSPGIIPRNAGIANLMRGRTPDGKVHLVSDIGEDKRIKGWQYSFTVDDAVSVLWANSPPEARRRIEKAHWNATTDTISKIQVELKLHLNHEREGRHSEFALSAFQHRIDEMGRPDLKIDCVLFNLSCHSDGTVTSIPVDAIGKSQEALGTAYQRSLKEWFFSKTSLAMESHGDQPILAGVPGRAIDALRGEHSTHTPNEKLQRASFWFNRWQSISKGVGFGPTEAQHLLKFHTSRNYSKREANQYWKIQRANDRDATTSTISRKVDVVDLQKRREQSMAQGH